FVMAVRWGCLSGRRIWGPMLLATRLFAPRLFARSVVPAFELASRRCHHLGRGRHGLSLNLGIAIALGSFDRPAADPVARAPGPPLRLPLATAPPPTTGAMSGPGIGGARRAFLLVDQRLPVGDRDLIVVGMNFAEGQEPVAVAAVVDESRLQRRFDAC